MNIIPLSVPHFAARTAPRQMCLHALGVFCLLAEIAPCRLLAEDDNPSSPKPVPSQAVGSRVPVLLQGDGWMTYRNPRFGFHLPVPPGLGSNTPPTNGDGQSFTSTDGLITLTGSGWRNEDGYRLEESWMRETGVAGRTITYQRKEKDWYVISGVDSKGIAFYSRFVADERYVAEWEITYPISQEKMVIPWIERISRDYDPRLGSGEEAN